MLQVIYTTDINVLQPLSKELFGGEVEGGVKAVLYDGKTPIGLAVLTLSDVVELTKFAVKSEYDSFPVIDFFLRVILYKLSLMDYTVFVGAVDERLIKFGFTPVEGGMAVASKDIKFPSSCKH